MSDGVVLSENMEYQIQKYSGDTLNAVTQFDHIGEMLHSDAYGKASRNLAEVISGMVKEKKEKDFHNSLKFYEKLGFISSQKQHEYEKRINIAGQATAIAVNTAAAALPYIVDAIDTKMSKVNFEKFFMSWVGYINQNSEITPIMVSNTQKILIACNSRLERRQIIAGIKTGQIVSAHLPHLNKKNLSAMNSSGEENMNSFAKVVVSTADLQQPQVYDRALEFLEEVFFIPYLDAKSKLEDIKQAQEYLSDFLRFSSFDYITFFGSLINSGTEAAKIGKYNAGMDVYAQNRKKNKEKVVTVAKTVGKIAGRIAVSEIMGVPAIEMGCLNPDLSTIKLSEGLMSTTLNPNHDSSVGREIMRAIIEQRKAYDLK